MNAFAEKLTEACCQRGNPVCVGLDPRWQSLPAEIKAGRNAASHPDQAAAYEQFCRGIIDVVATLVPVVKPQVAFFEQLGPPGMWALARVIAHARQSGLLVIADGKRNDIGSTAEAYADAWLGSESAWQADALTVSPYLGSDSLDPFVSQATGRGAGLFVLVKTSNPGGGQFQDLVADGKPAYEHVAAHVELLAQTTAGGRAYGAVGAVVGATYPEQLHALRQRMPHAILLVPGYGSQGGTARDVAAAFDDRGCGAIINNSRGIIFAHEKGPHAPLGWPEAVAAATRDMIEQLRAETTAGRLADRSAARR